MMGVSDCVWDLQSCDCVVRGYPRSHRNMSSMAKQLIFFSTFRRNSTRSWLIMPWYVVWYRLPISLSEPKNKSPPLRSAERLLVAS
jgi:hypothetical protein